MSIGDDLQKLVQAADPAQVVNAPQKPVHGSVGRDWQPGVQYGTAGDMTVTTPAGEKLDSQQDWTAAVQRMGLTVPEGWTVRLVEARYNQSAWTREGQGEDAITKPSWCYKFRIEPAKLSGYGTEDIVTMVRDVMRRKKPPKVASVTDSPRALVVVYADAQAGKTGYRGGSDDLVGRIADKFDKLEQHIKDLKAIGQEPTEAVWMDAGDCIENFENTAQQAFTNDLTLTQQVRLHRRLTFDGVERLARRFPKVTVAGCASNHGQVRRNGKQTGPPSDDWGLECLAQVADAFSRNEAAYGHVKFVFPEEWRESVSLDVAGTLVGLAHGHQFRPGKGIEWWKGQSFGNQPVAGARVLVTAHYHHYRVETAGNGRLWLQAPTLDNGSDWYTNVSGEDSPTGLMVFSVSENGIDHLRIL